MVFRNFFRGFFRGFFVLGDFLGDFFKESMFGVCNVDLFLMGIHAIFGTIHETNVFNQC